MTNSLPPVGTKIMIKSLGGYSRVKYVSGYTHGDLSTRGHGGVSPARAAQHAADCERNNKIVANDTPGEYHGSFYYSDDWKYADAQDNPDNYGMSDEQVKTLVRKVIKAARARGYCSEAENILADVGLPTAVPEVKTFTVEVEVESGETVDSAPFYDIEGVISVTEAD